MTRTATTIIAALLAALQMEISMAYAQTQDRPQVGTQTQPAFPNGATSLNEAYQDWTVLCATSEKGRICLMTQQQRKSDTNQLVLAAEFNAVSANEMKGTLVLPFGLRLADGVVLQIDEQALSAPLPFATCLPTGCIIAADFDAGMVKALRAGAALKLTAKAHDTGQNVLFSISLKGFAATQDRAVALSAQ